MLSKWINGRSLNINLTTPPFLPGRDVLVGHFDSKQVCDVFCGIFLLCVQFTSKPTHFVALFHVLLHPCSNAKCHSVRNDKINAIGKVYPGI